jgi:hypothetical protein
MNTRLELESAIKQLPEKEVRNLAKWLQAYLDKMWDQQIESDSAAFQMLNQKHMSNCHLASGSKLEIQN